MRNTDRKTKNERQNKQKNGLVWRWNCRTSNVKGRDPEEELRRFRDRLVSDERDKNIARGHEPGTSFLTKWLMNWIELKTII